ncbi:MAG: DUF1835 domain-containing protein [Saprospiraceae bacterium]
MRYHILNGDTLAETFPVMEIPGDIIVIREAFIEGPLTSEFSEEYWYKRVQFVTSQYGANKEEYEQQFGSQRKQMESISDHDEVCLWFEDDLFCQANMWFSIYSISSRAKPKHFRVFPHEDKARWSGFGKSSPKELVDCFTDRVELSDVDISLSNAIWKAYAKNDTEELRKLSLIDSKGFRFLPEVVSAHIERTSIGGEYGRPQQTLVEILNEGKTNFYEICDSFWERNAIYGFGDLQVYRMLKEMEVEFSGELY